MEVARLSSLKSRLSKLRYDQPLGVESAPLVERLLDDLVKSQQRQAELVDLSQKRADELSVAEQHVLPVRKENSRLVRENNELHLQLIADAEAAEASRLELSAAAARLREQNADLRFISSQQTGRLDELQKENAALRERFHEALMQNGIVLPSGHEVRWHGHKEHMKAHSPVAPAATEGLAAGAASAPDAAREAAKKQLHAAAVQAAHLQQRLEHAEARAASLEEQLTAGKTAMAQRDAELSRLQQAAAAQSHDDARLSIAHVNEEKNLTIAQLNHQVDFLNAQ